MDNPVILTIDELNHMWLIPVTAEQVTGEGTPLFKRWRELSTRYERTKPFASKELASALFILNSALSGEIIDEQPKGLSETIITKVSDLPEPNDPSQRPPWHDVQINPMLPPADLNEKGEPPTPA